MKTLKSLFKKQIEKDNIEEYYGHRSSKHEHIKPYHNSDGHSRKDIEQQSGTKYQCPMKCEGDKVYDSPGNCPVCNMNLIPVK